MSDARQSVINDIVQKTGLDPKEVDVKLDEMLANSQIGTKNQKEAGEKFRESVSAFLFLHKKETK